MVQIKIKWAEGADASLPLPSYATSGAAGADLRANLPCRGVWELAPMARCAIPTGLCVEFPQEFEIQIRPRSGLARRHGLTMLNAPGTIDSDFRGEIHALLVNLGDAPAQIRHGDRIAQMIVAPVLRASFALADELGETARGGGGFGSTGVSG